MPTRLCMSSLPSPVTTARAERIRASKPTSSSTNAAPGTSSAPNAAHRPPESPPAAPVMGTPRGSRVKPPGQRVQARGEALDVIGTGPLLGREHPGGVLERRAHVAEHHQPRVPEAAGALDRLDRARAPVGGGAATDPEVDDPGARLHRRGDELAGARGAGGKRVALGLVRRGSARWPPRCPRPPRRRPAPNSASIGRPSGSVTGAVSRSRAQPGGQRIKRALAPVGDGAQVRRAAGGLKPAADRGGHLGGAERPLEGVRRHQHGLRHAGDAAHASGQLTGSSTNTGICRSVLVWYSS